MVVTDLEHVPEQLALTPSLQKAIDFLERTRGQELADGREEVEQERKGGKGGEHTEQRAGRGASGLPGLAPRLLLFAT